MTSEEGPRCRLSHPNLPHTLSIRKRGKPNIIYQCISCDGKHHRRRLQLLGADHYYCTHCDVSFHQDCYTYPKKMTHPFHLSHPLTLIHRLRNFGTAEIDKNVTNCTRCGQGLGEEFYHCSVCSFSLDMSCSKQDPLLTIPKSNCHHHSLSLLTKSLIVPCHACGLVDKSEPSYVCSKCNYMVHQSCTRLPRVIKITRHPHRLFYTPSLPPSVVRTCGVCYKKIDDNYGHYSCDHKDCSYAVHSKCATDDQVWDGKELEGESEKLHEAKDVEPFTTVSLGLIKHFSHSHNLRLEKYVRVRDAKKECRACVLPIDSSHNFFYNCEQCDFCLHEVCARLPRKLNHALHKHTLVLDPSPVAVRDDHYDIECSTCCQRSTGFRYRCSDKKCIKNSAGDDFNHIDVQCILVPEYFTDKSHHGHPLCIFMSHSDNKIRCKVCKKICWNSYLQCTQCEFGMCYQCATVPSVTEPLTVTKFVRNFWNPTKWF